MKLLQISRPNRSMTPTGPKSAAALTQIAPIALVAKQSATVSFGR